MRTATEISAEIAVVSAKAKEYDRIVNEGGEGHNPHHATLNALLAELTAADQVEFAAAWTAEITAARRGQWNALVKAASARGEKWSGKDQAAAEKQIGFTVADLRRAIALHGGK